MNHYEICEELKTPIQIYPFPEAQLEYERNKFNFGGMCHSLEGQKKILDGLKMRLSRFKGYEFEGEIIVKTKDGRLPYAINLDSSGSRPSPATGWL